MADDANPTDAGGDEATLARCAAELADGVERALGPWVEQAVASVAERWRPGASADLRSRAAQAGAQASAEVGSRVRALLETDVDQQRTGPLAVLREAVRYPTEILVSAGVPPAPRDAFASRAFPEDIYDLAPASFADLHPDVQEPGLVWGAAKAYVILARRRTQGRR